MGNACCSDETQRRIYDTTVKKAVDIDPSITKSTSIKFPPAKTPNKNNMIE